MASIQRQCRKVICIGRNYADHITELNNTRPKRPFFFLKPPSSIAPPENCHVLRPKGVNLHYEVELGLVMGRELRNSDPNDEQAAMAAIQGYVVAIDMTARNVQDSAKKAGLPWTIAKGFDTFCPISNLIPKHLIKDPHNVDLHLSVDNEMRQSDNSGLMLYRIPRILAEISQVMTIEAGDLVLTGTPKGVGEVKTGQIMRAWVTQDGKELQNGRVEAEVKDSMGCFEFGDF
ncbi:fumarylacetoacetate hydrolase [Uncinocarpus reesii 1704]|uniref:Fumarylacetoacetate hydrolase n=1 Tax=Uncinocarpus reesii (strain UAMH 1704) TaxID=336963 RepID=C4JZU2_UNCRE|nr:fumarylacetoacetate hydrolase [Uncinocarpus reesii 1704]EEP82828.1 fumarylacetoacetate hydrolase [Uncinocarpus reesii 1704]